MNSARVVARKQLRLDRTRLWAEQHREKSFTSASSPAKSSIFLSPPGILSPRNWNMAAQQGEGQRSVVPPGSVEMLLWSHFIFLVGGVKRRAARTPFHTLPSCFPG